MISAVILAAGRSRRMGTQKLLLPLFGQPVITRIVDEVLEDIDVPEDYRRMTIRLSGRTRAKS